MLPPDALDQVRTYYAGRLAQHGATARGVDWNSQESQELRFDQLVRLLAAHQPASINDYGCGHGSLLRYLRKIGLNWPYTGFDIVDTMIAAARAESGDDEGGAHFVNRREELRPADFTVASGVFNVKLECPAEAWKAYIHDSLDDLAAVSRRGFVFNVLSTKADPDRRRSDLYYADPLELSEWCRQRFSPQIALLHDYPLYELTLLVLL